HIARLRVDCNGVGVGTPDILHDAIAHFAVLAILKEDDRSGHGVHRVSYLRYARPGDHDAAIALALLNGIALDNRIARIADPNGGGADHRATKAHIVVLDSDIRAERSNCRNAASRVEPLHI